MHQQSIFFWLCVYANKLCQYRHFCEQPCVCVCVECRRKSRVPIINTDFREFSETQQQRIFAESMEILPPRVLTVRGTHTHSWVMQSSSATQNIENPIFHEPMRVLQSFRLLESRFLLPALLSKNKRTVHKQRLCRIVSKCLWVLNCKTCNARRQLHRGHYA